MHRLFWGVFFVLLNVKIQVGTASIGLLPDFIGYFLLLKVMEALAGENQFFDRGRHVAFGLLIVSVILYAADLLNPDSMIRVWLWLLQLAALIGLLVLLWMMIRGLGRMANDYRLDLRVERLQAMWMALAVLEPVCHGLRWVPLVGTVCQVASLVTGVCFLIALYGTRKQFDAFDKHMRA